MGYGNLHPGCKKRTKDTHGWRAPVSRQGRDLRFPTGVMSEVSILSRQAEQACRLNHVIITHYVNLSMTIYKCFECCEIAGQIESSVSERLQKTPHPRKTAKDAARGAATRPVFSREQRQFPFGRRLAPEFHEECRQEAS